MSIAFLVLADRAELLLLPPPLLLLLVPRLLLLIPLSVLLVVRLRIVRFPLLVVPLRLIVEEEDDFLGISRLAQHNI